MNTFNIAWKEIKSYFGTPAAYIVGAMFLGLTGVFFVAEVTAPFAEAGVRGIVEWASFFIIFLAPLLTMRLLAEEQKLGTLELLLTSPVRDWEVVLGKYIASFLILAAIVAVTLYYVVLLYSFGDPDTGPALSGYLGLLLYGASALAIGLLGSSLSSNQIVAAVVGIAILLMLSFVNLIADIVTGIASEVFNGMSMNEHIVDFSRGVIDTSSVVFFLSLTAVFLFLSIRSLETRRWR
ncbi:MAG: ABC transporter permease subunit [Dehalococcoidia bacterium]|nr:ABC transporter permease subunit [Dehalococcoidia bacterium]